MFHASEEARSECRHLHKSRAVGDYHVVNPRAQKVKKSDRQPQARAPPENPDILAWVARRPRPPFCVDSQRKARSCASTPKRSARAPRSCPCWPPTRAERDRRADENEVTCSPTRGAHELPRAPQEQIARQLIAQVARLLHRNPHQEKKTLSEGEERKGSGIRVAPSFLRLCVFASRSSPLITILLAA